MTSVLFWSDLRQRLRSPASGLLFAGLFVYTAATMMGGDTEQLAGGSVPHNAAFVIYYWSMYAGFWVAVLGPALMASPLLRDVRVRFAPLVFSTPISDAAYFWGKYFASLVATNLVLIAIPAAMILTPWIVGLAAPDALRSFLPQTPWRHIALGWAVWVLPACFIYGSLHYAFASLTGRSLLSYGFAVVSMAVFTLFFVAFDAEASHRFWIEALDPMGKQTMDGQALLWSVPERATHLLQATPSLLVNRALYVGTALAALLIARLRFSLPHLLARARNDGTRAGGVQPPTEAVRRLRLTEAAPQMEEGRHPWAGLLLLVCVARRHWRTTWTGVVFRAVVAALVMIAVTSAWAATAELYNSPENHLLPAAQYLLTVVQPQSFMLLTMVMIYFSGELAARDQDSRMSSLVGSTPVGTGALAGGIWLAVTLLGLTLSLIPTAAVIIVQLLSGYLERAPIHFLRGAVLQIAPLLLAYGWLSVAVYGMTRHRLLSQGLPMIVLWAGIALHESGVIEQNLLLLIPAPMLFSDFDVLSADTTRHLAFAAYYLGGVGLLVVAAVWFWQRGLPQSLAARARQVPRQLTPMTVVLAVVCATATLAGGEEIWRQLHVVNDFKTRAQSRTEAAEYERRYGFVADLPTPTVSALTLDITLAPEQGRVDFAGRWQLLNAGESPIEELYIAFPEQGVFMISGAASLELYDADYAMARYRLTVPLAPGQTTSVGFTLHTVHQGFTYEPFEATLGRDSVLVDTSWLPRIGYDRTRELSSVAQRSLHGLGPRRHPPRQPDRFAVNDQANRASVDLTVSAPADLQVSASGTRVGEYEEHGRRHSSFHMQGVPLKILLAASRVTTSTRVWTSADGRRISIVLRHHPAHTVNALRFFETAAATLSQMEALFGPYPYDHLEIAETAQFRDGEDLIQPCGAGPLIVLPERRGWLHDYRQDPRRDYLAFTLGEQIARVWWGQSVAAEAGPGAALVDDGVPIFLGLKMIENRRGVQAADAYASLLRDRYRKEVARSDEPVAAILDTQDQSYAAVGDALAMFDRRRRLGEVRFDSAMATFFRQSRDQGRGAPIWPARLAFALGLDGALPTTR